MSVFGRKKEDSAAADNQLLKEENQQEPQELSLEEKDGVLVVQQEKTLVLSGETEEESSANTQSDAEDIEEDGVGGQKPPEGALKAQKRAKERARRVFPAILVSLLYLLLAFLMFQNANNAVIQGAAVSMRYRQPLKPETVKSAKFTMANPDIKADFSAAYWYQSPKETLSNERGKVETPTLFVDGDMATVLRVNFLHGNYPSAVEKRGLAVSEGLAWDLFGGSDVVGAEIDWNGEVFIVRGVFAGDPLLLLAQIDAAETKIPGFSGVELTGAPEEGDPRDAAKEYAKKAGLGEPDVLLNSKTVPGIILLIAWLPAALLTMWFAYRSLRLLHTAAFWKRQLVWFGVILLLAYLVPKGLSMMPGWMIPTRWSDFEHWRLLFKEMNRRTTEWLAITPSLWDIQLKKQLIYQVALFVPALLAVLSMIRRWGQHMKRKEAALRFAALGQKKQPEQLPEGEKPLLPEGKDTAEPLLLEQGE